MQTSPAASGTQVPDNRPTIHFDVNFLKSIPGVIKIVEALCSLIGFICIQSIYAATFNSAGGWYSFVSMTAFWVSLILLLAYTFHVIERLNMLPWIIFEMGFAGLWAIFFFIASCVAAANGKFDPGYGAAAFFGFSAMCIFGYETFLRYKSWRSGAVAQGEKRTTTPAESGSVTGPSYPTY